MRDQDIHRVHSEHLNLDHKRTWITNRVYYQSHHHESDRPQCHTDNHAKQTIVLHNGPRVAQQATSSDLLDFDQAPKMNQDIECDLA